MPTPFIKQKIWRVSDRAKHLAQWQLKKYQIVFTNGCFDLIHQGHLEVLAAAKEMGDKLIVGLNTDQSVRRIKGESRPIKNEEERALMLASLLFVDAVILFNEETPEQIIKEIKPDILVKGGDWEVHQIVGSDFVQSYGGVVKTIPLTPGFSTTKTIQQITDRNH